jgi:hypothetical protein
MGTLRNLKRYIMTQISEFIMVIKLSWEEGYWC